MMMNFFKGKYLDEFNTLSIYLYDFKFDHIQSRQANQID
jgi:hypothetical protein